ncbi:AGAP000094-PA-like protein [Anopheles sinensis]|uniref:AGAP000094-PA-like protein n=1 Tax=Anopheles sinensis TaxID=74873 RepID=A0A084WPM3_ANOSI|nr:AGAP000094-PA-like protein [Anopheles sinensis]
MSRGRHILELSEEESRQFLGSFDAVVLDCDGVLWSVYDSIEGADAALKLLRGSGKTVKFITNNSVRPIVSYRQQLQALGFAVQEADIIHPAASIVRYLRARAFDGLIYCLGTDNFKGVLQQAGFQLLDGPAQPLPESFHQIIATVDDRAPVRAVVVDVDFNANYPKLMRAEMYLKRHPDCLLIAGAPDRKIHVKPGCDMIGPGAFVELLEKAVGKRAIVLGKPGYHLRSIVRDQCELGQPARTLLIGDMLEQDMAFASLCGFQKLLVLSGGTSKEQMLRTESPLQEADYYADSLKDFVQLYAKAYSRK